MATNSLYVLLSYSCSNEKLQMIRLLLFSSGDIANRIEVDTKAKIEGMQTTVGTNKQKVIDSLIDLVCDIKPKVHVNFRG